MIEPARHEADTIEVGAIGIRYLVEGAATGGMGVFELRVPPGAAVPPPHRHSGSDECIYVLEGGLRYTVDDETRDLRRGDSMFTPRGSVHHFVNVGGEPALALVILTPDIGAQYFRDVREVMSAGGPPDRARIAAVMARHGLVPAAPGSAGSPVPR